MMYCFKEATPQFDLQDSIQSAYNIIAFIFEEDHSSVFICRANLGSISGLSNYSK